jgi:uncharacterized protein (DUF1015 family)
MADLLPLKAWRYNEQLTGELGNLISPLFDVVTERQREKLYENPFNSIHLSLPAGSSPADQAKTLLEAWKKRQVIVQDYIPGIYVYYQFFKVSDREHPVCRKGFIAQIKVEDWHKQVVLRHEGTSRKGVSEREELLGKTLIQASPTFGLYEDPEFGLEEILDQAMEDPVYDLEDYQGVREVMGIIHDAAVINRVIKFMKGKQILIADGHHRYSAALEYAKKRNSIAHPQSRFHPFCYHEMYFCNASSQALIIFPNHRVFRGLGLGEGELLEKVAPYFTFKEVEDQEDIEDIINNKRYTFGLVFRGRAYLMSLREDCLTGNFGISPQLKNLEVYQVHYFLVQQGMGIPMDEQPTSTHLHYERHSSKCFLALERMEAEIVVIMPRISAKKVFEVCKSGEILPQKATYFYPKVVSGLLFGSIKPEDFEFPYEVFI